MAAIVAAYIGKLLLEPERIRTAASAVEAGASVEGSVASMVQAVDRSVVCGIELSNATKYFLKAEGYFPAWGQVKTPPVSASPGMKEAIIAQKTFGTTTGTTGVVVWKVGDTSTRLVIMWSIPWNHNHHDNVLAVGFKEGEVKLENELYREMYYEKETWFQRHEYSKDGSCQPVEIIHKTKCFKIHGTMGTDHKCEVRVECLPLTKGVVAESLKSVVFDY